MPAQCREAVYVASYEVSTEPVTRGTLRANGVLFVGLFRPVDVIDPPAARETDQRKSRAVLSFIGTAKMELQSYAGTCLRRLSRAQHFAMEHPPMGDDQFVPHVERNLLAVSRGEHVVSRAHLPAIER